MTTYLFLSFFALATSLVIVITPKPDPPRVGVGILVASQDTQSVMALMAAGYSCSSAHCTNVPAKACTSCTTEEPPTKAVNLTTTLLVVNEHSCGSLDNGNFIFRYTAEPPTFSSGGRCTRPSSTATIFTPTSPIFGQITGFVVSVQILNYT